MLKCVEQKRLKPIFLSDIDECDDGPYPCAGHACCRNTVGNFSCACDDGFNGNGLTCTGEIVAKTFMDLLK